MGLELPNLDDRPFEDILEDRRKHIPVYSKEWTDHNVHDPGITILEVLAWLAETYNYQLDQITDVHLRKYLRLIGRPPKPPVPATVPLRVTLPTGVSGQTIPGQTQLCADDRSGQQRVFETTDATALTEATVARVVSKHQRGQTDNTNANDTNGLSFLAFGEQAEWGSRMYLGFEGDPFTNHDHVTLRFDFDEESLPPMKSHGNECPAFEPSVQLRWQYCTDCENWFQPESWNDLTVTDDGTNRLYRGGTITVRKLSSLNLDHGEILDINGSFRWIRCTVRKPEPEGPAQSAGPGSTAPLGTSRSEAIAYEVPPRLDSARTNVLGAIHRSTRQTETGLKRIDGGNETTARPGQEFTFKHAPLFGTGVTVGDTPVLEARIEIDGKEWTRKPDFDGSGPDDEHFVLDESKGVVRFGDGVRGTVPIPDQTVVAPCFTAGGGLQGNVPRTAAWTFGSSELITEGLYTYYSASPDASNMKGAIMVGAFTNADERLAIKSELAAWFDEPAGSIDIRDRVGAPSVTIKVGFKKKNEQLVFRPRAVQVDPGTPITFRWQSTGHNIVVDRQPPDGTWLGHPPVGEKDHEYVHSFPANTDLREFELTAEEDATGGRKAESLTTALVELKRDMQTPYRAVSLADYEFIATHTPGLRFGRAKALVQSPHQVGECAPHERVAVVVVPYSPLEKPQPSDGFLEAVRDHLCEHLLITDQVDVRPPTYVGIGIDAEVRLASGYSSGGRAKAVTAALTSFIHPLDGFGGAGWPFGRDLYRSEVYEVIERVEGIDCVISLSIRADGEYTIENGTIEIEPDALLYSLDHRIEARGERDECRSEF